MMCYSECHLFLCACVCVCLCVADGEVKIKTIPSKKQPAFSATVSPRNTNEIGMEPSRMSQESSGPHNYKTYQNVKGTSAQFAAQTWESSALAWYPIANQSISHTLGWQHAMATCPREVVDQNQHLNVIGTSPPKSPHFFLFPAAHFSW